MGDPFLASSCSSALIRRLLAVPCRRASMRSQSEIPWHPRSLSCAASRSVQIMEPVVFHVVLADDGGEWGDREASALESAFFRSTLLPPDLEQ